MTRLLDGPAAGQVLLLQRAPVFLRVVLDSAGKVDALDLVSDEPDDAETIFVYRIVPNTRKAAHINFGRCGRTGWYRGGDYRLTTQPGDEVMRRRDAWQAWTRAELARTAVVSA
jgi:hypothetical protein